jgi:glycogen operon protein
MSGSPDLYDHAGRTPEASVNFVTAHDGFTVRDLVSYDRKHNDANKEHNRDGTDDNRSWNCGVEGETYDAEINALRRRQVKNLLATMFLSFGTPMITAGDELGRTQLGNNNAYCQDGPISWVEWGGFEEWRDVHDFASQVLALRAQHSVLRSSVFRHRSDVLDGRRRPLGRPDLAWLNGYSGEMTTDDWHDEGRTTLGMYVSDASEAFISWFHSGDYLVEITLPDLPWGSSYRILLHTGDADELPAEDVALASGTVMTLPPRSVVVMKVDVPTRPARSRKRPAS